MIIIFDSTFEDICFIIDETEKDICFIIQRITEKNCKPKIFKLSRANQHFYFLKLLQTLTLISMGGHYDPLL